MTFNKKHNIDSLEDSFSNGMTQLRVFVYFNLHKRVWSVKALEGPYRGKVVAHILSITLSEVYGKVSEKGRQRVIATRQKNVHAGIVGYWDGNMDRPESVEKEITYNPYRYRTFVYKNSEQPFTSSSLAYMADKRVFVK